MRKLAAIAFLSLAVISCGNSEEKTVEEALESGNLNELRQKKSELGKQQADLNRKIERLDAAINELDTTRNRSLVSIKKVQDTLFRHFAEVQGDVATDENIVIFSETSGILTEVKVEEGEHVSQGQVLALVDNGGLDSELERLQTQAELAKTTYERQKRLWDQNIGSEMQFLQARSSYRTAQEMVEQVKTRLEKSIITAPFSGIIDEIITEQGEVVAPGQNQLFRLVSLDDMYIEADIPENYLGEVKEGTAVIIEIGSAGIQFPAEVDRISSTINPSNRTFQIEIAVPEGTKLIRPNQIATVKINDYSNESAIILPQSVVQQNSRGQDLVYVWEPEGETTGIARQVFVKTGHSYGDFIEITNGLQPGQMIITQGSRNLRDGQEVKIETSNDNE